MGLQLKLLFSLLFLVALLNLHATELQPWFSPDYEIQSLASYRFQQYRYLETPNGSIPYHAHDHFLTVSGEIAKENCAAEFEIIGAITRVQHAQFDSIRLTGRYLLLDDVAGNYPVSAVLGLTVIEASKRAIKDPSSFHHGQFEGELHLSIGKECSYLEFWTTRIWGLAAIGYALERGSPWLRGDLTWEKNWWNRHRLSFGVHTLWGLGGRNLPVHCCFPGYANIRHQSIDLGLSYRYLFDMGLSVTAEYAHRVLARNYPGNANQFVLSLHYPIGL